MSKDFIIMTHLFFLFSCAGPTDPFGAINQLSRASYIEDIVTTTEKNVYEYETKSKINFEPQRQVLHREGPLQLVINDQIPIPETYELRFFYNGQEISEKFLKQSRKEKSQDLRTMTFSFKDLKLMPAKDHDIIVAYRSSAIYPYKYYQYALPSCPLRVEQKLKDLESFNPDEKILELIQKEATKQEINSALLTSLIAQESGFDANAISSSKALGLTQVTKLAGDHILKKYTSWPIYRELEDLSLLEIKTKISQGDLNAQRDWRLDPEKSIKGGAYYINYLDHYWSKNFPDLDLELRNDLVLASYNSGATRVRQSLNDNRTNWINNPALTQAKVYVNKIKSYCYHSNKQSDDL
jgi:hypothetical protein